MTCRDQRCQHKSLSPPDDLFSGRFIIVRPFFAESITIAKKEQLTLRPVSMMVWVLVQKRWISPTLTRRGGFLTRPVIS
jgi:hypothetical protein